MISTFLYRAPTPQKTSGGETPVLPNRPEGTLPNVIELDTYVQLAGEIGFSSPALLIQRLKNFFAKNGLPIYDTNKVERYMDRLAKSEGKTWNWVPMRELDAIDGAQRGGDNGSVTPGGHIYSREIPIQVLRTVWRIPEDLRDALRFYVSEYHVAVPDPFLMVMPKNVWNGGHQNRHLRLVIAVWDEPGFGSE